MSKSLKRYLASAAALLALLSTDAAAQGKRPQRAASEQNFRDCQNCPLMATIPAGEFLMGSPGSERGRNKDEGPQRKVTFAQPFAIGKFEVTFAEWDACAAKGACSHKPGDEGWGRAKRPVINISWDDAREYVAWLASTTGRPYRLPTEAEWEYAARGVSDTVSRHQPFATGTTISYKQANFDANFVYGTGKIGIYRQKTLDVGSLPRNAFGLHDMHGNVWEWVEDCYRQSYADAPGDGSAVTGAACDLRVARGGAWNYYPALLRSAYRYSTPGNVRLNNIGLRVARAL